METSMSFLKETQDVKIKKNHRKKLCFTLKKSELKKKENILNFPSFINKKRKRLNTSKTKDSENDKYDFSKKENLFAYIKTGCEEFNKKFVVLESLKVGGSGNVYKGHLFNKQNIPVILKFLMHNVTNSEKNELKNEFEKKHNEILIHNKLRHKNISEVYGYYKINEGSCIVMEYFKYGDIENFKKKITQKKILTESFLNYLSINILNALDYIHKNKIIHLDIKPQNILINEYLLIKLTDFSVSYNYKNTKNENDLIQLPSVGTSFYMSPEILDETKNCIKVKDASKIDLYSLGVTLYFLAFYDYPYNLKEINHKNYEGLKEAIKKNELKFPEKLKCSKMFLNFIKNLLNKDLNHRYNIKQALVDPWIKGSKILLEEKEILNNSEKFFISLLSDSNKEFIDYVHEK